MNDAVQLDRRGFLLSLAASPAIAANVPDGSRPRVIDAHDHLSHHSISNWKERDRQLIEVADKLGIDQLCCSIVPPEHPMTLEGFRDANRWLADGIRRFPGRILGQCIVNPGYGREALEEIRRAVGEGFIGIKLYNDYRITEPVVRGVIELAIELKVPLLQHGGHTTWLSVPQPRISDGSHVAEVAKLYPEAMIICAHVCGGGDWEWTIKSLRNAPSVYLDTSGSVIDDGVVEMAARVLGPDRLLFACDQAMTASVGRMRSAELEESARRKIMGGNMQRILGKRGRA
ncbi:MAG: amidohydrolase family protein [Acidobacteria bacterium]|nr:amidohydrolase family protein [Acidobacteriota bacterium]